MIRAEPVQDRRMPLTALDQTGFAIRHPSITLLTSLSGSHANTTFVKMSVLAITVRTYSMHPMIIPIMIKCLEALSP